MTSMQNGGGLEPSCWMGINENHLDGALWFSSNSATAATVGEWNTVDNGRLVLKTALVLDSKRIASSEWPPSSKKLSRRPTRSSLSTSAQIRARRSSVSP